MNRFLLALALSTTSIVAIVGQPAAQVADPPVVEVPAVTDEQIEEVVVPQAPTVSSAQELPQPGLTEPARLSPTVVTAWLEDPDSLLTTYVSGGPAMIEYVALVAGSDARTIIPLIELAIQPTTAFRHLRAIAFGLASASKAAQESSPEFSAYLLLRVASSGNQQLIDYFAQALRDEGDIETSELGTVVGSLVPSGGGVGTVSGDGSVGGSGITGGTSVVGVSAGSFSGGGGGGGAGDDDNNVSPTIAR